MCIRDRFTVNDLQRWTGWAYQRARRTMIGYTGRGSARYPGLLDKSPALSLIDQTVADPEDESRSARQRQHVFVFDLEVYEETRVRGEAWLDEETEQDQQPARCSPVDGHVD